MASILLVDDDDSLRKMLGIALKMMGHCAIEARDGDEALKVCREQIPDVVLTDLIMPGKEGLETIKEIRRRHPNLPIIAMSGGGLNSPGAYLALAKSLGAVRVLTKPFAFQEMDDAIKEALDRSAKPDRIGICK